MNIFDEMATLGMTATMIGLSFSVLAALYYSLM